MERRPTRILTILAVSLLALTLIAPWCSGRTRTRSRKSGGKPSRATPMRSSASGIGTAMAVGCRRTMLKRCAGTAWADQGYADAQRSRSARLNVEPLGRRLGHCEEGNREGG